MRKFNFIIIDDEFSASAHEGWGRVMSFLHIRFYLLAGVENINDTGNASLNYSIFSKENKKTFNQAKEHLSLHKNDYDFFFFDIDLANKDNAFFSGEDQKIYLTKKFEKLNSEEKSVHLAGLEFINVLSKDKRPKIFFSGSADLQILLQYFNLIKNRLDDVLFADLKLGNEFAVRICRVLDDYILRRQYEVCMKMSSEDSDVALKNLRAGHFDAPCIPNSTDKSDMWSLRSLFPKQCNMITRLYKNDFSVEETENLILNIENIIISYPNLLKTLSSFAHDSEIQLKNKLLKSTVHFLKEKEFGKDNFKNGVTFIPLTNFLNIESPSEVTSFKENISNNPWEFKSHASSQVIIEPHIITECLLSYGFYPGYLDYILGIVKNNAQKMNQKVKIEKYQFRTNSAQKMKQLEIEIVVKGTDKPITTENLERARKKGSFAKNDSCFCGANSEGIEDILKIVCFRYNGSFEFITLNYTVRFKAIEEKLESNLVAETQRTIPGFTILDGIFKIIIPQLK